MGALLLILFFLIRLTGIDPIILMIGDSPSQELYERTKKEMGFDKPPLVQFGQYVKHTVTGDLGTSFITKQPVLKDLARVIPATIELATLAFLLSFIIGIPLGLIAAFYKNSIFDKGIRIFFTLSYATPTFALALLSLYFFYFKFDLFPGSGRLSFWHDDFAFEQAHSQFLLFEALVHKHYDIVLDLLHHMLLPASILALVNGAYIGKMLRVFLLQELAKTYILSLRMRGFSKWKIAIHALRNCRFSLLNVIILCYGHLLEGSVITETIFSWPGLGLYLVSALKALDINATLGSTMVIGMLYIILNKTTDYFLKQQKHSA